MMLARLLILVSGVAALLGNIVDDVVDLVTDNAIVDQPRWPEDYSSQLQDGDSFEYVVVGAGAAGSAVASRLALAGFSVLLVEAGGDPSLFTRIPGLASSLLNSDMDWAYPTVPTNYSCLSSTGQQCRFSRGFCLGGSTSINYMLYVRGHHQDCDDWDIDGWTYEDVEPYFLRYEGLQDLDKLPESSKPYHNTEGILKVGLFGDTENDWHPRFIQGYEELNFPNSRDINGVLQVGVTTTVGYVYDRERMSTARAYLANDQIKSVLKVAKNTQCTGVVIDENYVAVGVKLTIKDDNRNITIKATKEVILSAGAIGTPQILMLSGIGPAEHLEEMGIEVKSDLPVGDNMSDHVLSLLFMQVDRAYGWEIPSLVTYGMKAVDAIEWLATKDGPLATIELTDILTFYNSKCYDYNLGRYNADGPECGVPTSEIILAYIDVGLLPPVKDIAQSSIGLTDEAFDQIIEANKDWALVELSPIVLRPDSRGMVRLASKDGLEKPKIYANYLEDERDVEEILNTIRVLEDLLETEPFKQSNASMLHIKLQDCPEYEEDREAYWSCYVRHLTYSVYHAVGTASLGTCVDERLRVKGVRNLRVADLSVVPVLPRGNTEAIAVAIGERLADFILQNN